MSVVPVSQQRAELFTKASDAFLEVLSKSGFDPQYERRIGEELCHQGLYAVGVEGRVYEMGGDLPLTSVWSLVVRRLREPMSKTGLLSCNEIDQVIDLIEGSDFLALSPTIIAAWGQRPQ